MLPFLAPRAAERIVMACLAVSSVTAQADPALLAGMRARSIGPAGMSGRVTAVEAVASDPSVIWVGAASGGVFKSIDAGVTFRPVFDEQRVASIGAIAIDPARPEVVWIGTGEGNTRNSVSIGDGVYRTNDGGETWTHLGLTDTERMRRIVLHPRDPRVAWVAALGPLWSLSSERGVFKTEDGGVTWRKVLYVDDATGCADLAVDPRNPDKLFASMWQHRREAHFFSSGGPGSGVHVSHDGGATWRKLTTEDGLPPGDLGRIGLAIAPSAPDTVYALVEATKSALLRSEDGGRTFQSVSQKHDVAPRPFYYAELRVDTERPQRIYNLHSLVTVSDDGGRNFSTLVPFRDVHPDHHAMWIDPRDGRHIIVGNDGGIAISRDRGKTWRFVENLPLAQYYHVAVDLETPYNVYGGMQDNGSWRGPASVWENGGIRNQLWEEVGFGDGFNTLPDPQDAMRGYSMSQQGYLMRWDLRTGERKSIRPASPAGTELRFNWNAALAQDPFEPGTIYFGSQFIHKSTDRGDSWETISDDLTTDNKAWQRQNESGGLTLDVTGAENFTTIVVIAPSATQQGVIWVGTDDGRVHVTRDGGKVWTSVERNIPGVPEGTWVPHVEASKFDPAGAFVVLDDHRRGNFATYVFRTDDWGQTWRTLATADLRGFAHTIEQDPVDQDLLFLGTEFGLFVSSDGGRAWLPFRHGLPPVPVMGLVVHPREHDLVIGTHGRAAYVIDDVTPLRTLDADVLRAPLHLFPPSAAAQHVVKQTAGSRFPGHGEFRGENRAYGALLTFSLGDETLTLPDVTSGPLRPKRPPAERPAQGAADKPTTPKAKVEILDAAGQVVRKLEPEVKRGLNRVAWDLRRKGWKQPQRRDRREGEDDDPVGPEVMPGDYVVRVAYKDHVAEAPIKVLPDPRLEISPADRAAKLEAISACGRLQEALAAALDHIREVRQDLEVISRKAKASPDAPPPADDDPRAALRRLTDEAVKDLAALEAKLWAPEDAQGILPSTDAFANVRRAMSALSSSWTKPTQAQLGYLERAEQLTREVLADVHRFARERVTSVRAAADKAAIQLLPDPRGLEIK
jgi:photosystem II stability/assembly factor-like uncharacterized protein